MATNTTNLQLVKPAPEDFYDIAVHNGNMDKLDEAIQELIDRPSGGVQTTGDTMTGKLNIETNGEALALKGTNTSFIGLYPRGTEREGYIGFGESTNNNIFITNEHEDGKIIFRAGGEDTDLEKIRSVIDGSFDTSVYINASNNPDSLSYIGIGGANPLEIYFAGDDMTTKMDFSLDQATQVLKIRNLFENGEIIFHDKDGDVKLSELKNPPAAPNVTKNYTGDWNNCKANGYYDGSNVANAPNGATGWFYVEVIAHSSNPGAWVTQTAYDFNSNNVWRRSLSNTTWGPWQLVYTAGNAPYHRNIHVSTAGPSGGVAGEVWHQYV